MTYLNKVKNLSKTNKYSKWYIEIIEKALLRGNSRRVIKESIGYVEAHHILPRCICDSEYDEKSNENLVYVTAREHFICHLLLTKMFDDRDVTQKLQYACNAFRFNVNATQRSEYAKISSKTYDLLKREYSKCRSEMNKGENNPNFGGKLQTEESKAKMRKPKSDSSKMGRYVRTEEARKRLSDSKKGKCTGSANSMASAENRAKVGASKVGRKLAINPTTKERKYVFPDRIPEGFFIG